MGNECVSRINLRFVNPSFQPLTNVVVAVQITEMLKYITGFSYPKTMNNRFVYDSFSHENEFQKI